MSSATALAELVGPFADAAAIHLNNAGVAPLSSRAERAIADTAQLMREGSLAMPRLLRRYEDARKVFGALVGADDVAFFQTCAAAISQVAFGFPFKEGDRVVRLDQEYPSNAYAWHRATERVGGFVDVVSSSADFSVDPNAVLSAITQHTKVVALSFVQFQTGTVANLADIAAAAHKVGAIVVVDAIQGLGVLPFDMRETGVDAVCGGTHKWLLGPVGHGFLAMTPSLRETLSPILQGAITYGTPDDPVDPMKKPRSDVHRFEPGTPLLLGAIGGAASIELLQEIGIARVHELAQGVAAYVVERALQRGYAVRPRSMSPIVTFVPPGDPAALQATLRDNDIATAARGGGIRLSPHAFNSRADIDRVFDVIA